MRVLLLLTLLGVTLTPSASALSEEGVNSIIDDAVWTYDEAWILARIAGDGAFTFWNATSSPPAQAIDAQTVRVWPLWTQTFDWVIETDACVSYPPDADEVGCIVSQGLSPPSPDMSGLEAVAAEGPGEFEAAVERSLTDGPAQIPLIADALADEAYVVVIRWSSDILALLP